MTDDLPVPTGEQAPVETPADPAIPRGSSVIHRRHDSSEIFRLCCRLRLDMRDKRLSMRDTHDALKMAYPDLKISRKELQDFLEKYVDEAMILDAGFWKKGVMGTKTKLNAVAEAANLADLAQRAVENIKGPISLQDLPKYTLAVERAQKLQERKYAMMSKVGMGMPTDRERAEPSKSTPVTPPVHIEHATFNMSDSVGGSFARRAGVVDAEGKAKAPG